MDNHRNHKRPESVLVLVHTPDKQVLLLRRIKPSYFWQSVAGSLEWNETPAAAARRELYEETGLSDAGLIDCDVSHSYVIYPMWRHRYAPGVVENREYLFRLQLDEPCGIQLDPQEHSEYRWMDKANALDAVVSHTNRGAIEKYVV